MVELIVRTSFLGQKHVWERYNLFCVAESIYVSERCGVWSVQLPRPHGLRVFSKADLAGDKSTRIYPKADQVCYSKVWAVVLPDLFSALFDLFYYNTRCIALVDGR